MRLRTAAIVGAMAIMASVLPGAAQATGVSFTHGGYAGGTWVTAIGLTVSSDMTAESQVTTPTGAVSQTNSTANVTVNGLLNVNAVSTSVAGSNFGDGSQILSHARTTGISLLNGLIGVQAVDTTAAASGSSTSAPKAATQTTFLGLTIAGKTYPANVPANTTIGIPGIATVILNYSTSKATSTGAVAIGAGLVVRLLEARAGAAAGSQITLNPVYAAVNRPATAVPGAPIGGTAYGSYVHAAVNGVATVESSPTARTTLPASGTNGNTITNSTTNVSVPGVLLLGAVQTEGSGIQSASLSDASETASVTKVSLFNGLITADAIGTTSHVRLVGGSTGTRTNQGSMTFVNLKVAGTVIPLNVAPNTVINVANLGAVTINEQYAINNAYGIRERVIGLHIVLSTARDGLPVGASVEVATSLTAIFG